MQRCIAYRHRFRWPSAYGGSVPHPLACLALRLAAIAALSSGADAAEGAPPSAFAAAVEQSPAVAAARSRLLATQAERAGADVLPDPQLSVNPEHDPAATRSRFGVTHTEVLLSQPLARWGERDARMLAALAGEGEALAELARSRGEVAAELSAALSDRELGRVNARLAQEAAGRARSAAARITALLASSPTLHARQLWSLQSRAEALELQEKDGERARSDAEAQARSLLGLGPDAALPANEAPAPAAVSIESSPQLALARARRLAARADELAARSRRRPQVTLTAGWEGGRGDNAYEGMVALSLPVHLGAYASGEAAAQARSGAAEAEERRAHGEAERLLATARRERTQADAGNELAQRTLARDEAEFAAVASAVGGGGADAPEVAELLAVLDRLADRRTALAEAEARAWRAAAELWRLAPPIPRPATTGGAP
jgi:outer membrane protein TolC